MKFELKRPCPGCPFRIKGEKRIQHLGIDRINDIVDSMIRKQHSFICHETTNRRAKDQQHCAGALIYLNKTTEAGYAHVQSARMAERLRVFNPAELEDSDEVANNLEELVEQHA